MTSTENGKLSGEGRSGFISDVGQMSPGRAEGDVDLTSTEGSKLGPALSPAIIELSAVITDCGFSPDRFCSSSNGEVPSSRDLERELKIAFDTYQQSRFTAAASRIATLLADAHLASRECAEAGYLQEADSAAQRLGTDSNHLWTAFGPTNVAIHRVNTAMELGDVQTALDSGPSLNTDKIPAERQVRYLLDIARAYSLTGNRDEALRTTLTAERIAPEQVRQHYLSRNIVMTLIQSTPRRPTIELERLADRVKVRELI